MTLPKFSRSQQIEIGQILAFLVGGHLFSLKTILSLINGIICIDWY